MILDFKVSRDILKKRTAPQVTHQNINYYKCKFYMDKNVWRNSLLFATFMNDLGYIETVELGEYNDVLSCLVPAQLTQGSFFSLYISDNNNRKTNTISVTLSNHYKKAKPKCNIISEIFEHINTKIDELVYDNYQIKCYSNGQLLDVIYLGNVDEEIVKDWVHEEMDVIKNTLANISFTGSFNDLIDIPENFPPSQHEHLTSDISDFNESVNKEIDGFIDEVIENL